MPGDGGGVVALFADEEAARRAGRELVFAGFRDDDVQLEEPRTGLLDGLLREDRTRGMLVHVSASGRALEAAAILHRAGGRDPDAVDSGSPSASSGTLAGEAAEAGGAELDLVTEDLVARVEPVQVGEVRVVKRVVTEKRTIEVEVRHEEVSVEHHPAAASGSPLVVREYEQEQPVAGPQDAAEEVRLADEDDLTRIPVFAEQVVVTRNPFVVEEVWIRKRRLLERRAVAGEVRREELEVEPLGDVAVEETREGAVVRPAASPQGDVEA